MNDTATTTTRTPVWARLAGGMQSPMPAGTTVPQALDLAGLSGWDVQKMPLVTLGHDDQPLPTDKIATVRRHPDGSSSVLGVGLGDGYAVVQNEQALAVDAVIGESGAAVDFAGAWQGGKRTFISLRLPETVLVGGQDRVDLYLTAMTSHDGSLALTMMATPVRFICTNVLPVMMKQRSNTYRVRHVGDAGVKIAEARAALELTFRYAEEWQQQMEALLDQGMTDAAFDRLVRDVIVPDPTTDNRATVLRVQENRDALHSLFADAPTQEFGRGTRYAAFNAVTEWTEWVRPRNPHTVTAAGSVLEGAAADVRQRAFRALARA